MIFQQIDFHNVEQMIPWENGYLMARLPETVFQRVNQGIRERSGFYSTGIELRFRLNSDSVDLWLRAMPELEAQVAYLFYGSIQGGWQMSSYVIGTEPTRLHLQKPDNLETLKRITEKERLPFSPEVIRLVLPYGNCIFLKAEGDMEPPRPGDTPADCYLAYGSSITHGSLALAAPYTYPFRIAQKMKCDYLNLGFAGTAQMEPAMAEYIVSRKDWSFASVEMGVNMLGESFSEKGFEQNIDRFTAILAKDPRPVFATSIFGFPGDQKRADQFRAIVKKYAESRLLFVDGLELLNQDAYISQDGVHPTLEGMEKIADRWFNMMNNHFSNKDRQWSKR